MKEKIILVANIVGIVLLISAGLISWNFFSEKQRSEHSLKEFELRKALEAGNTNTAKKIIEELQKSEQFRALALSYKLQIEKNMDFSSLLKEIIDSTKDTQLKALYTERYAYELYKLNQKEQALKELEKITSEDFNYSSAMILKAQILRSLNKDQEADKILQSITHDKKETYFANLAYALLLKGGKNAQLTD